MKIFKLLSCSLFFLLVFQSNNSLAQNTQDTSKTYVITKNDGTEFIGKIISQDAREVVIETKKTGQVAIPKHEIKEIKQLKSGDLSKSGEYISADLFATRYFITTNGLPINKGEGYIQWNLWGPDFQFGITDKLSMGLMTSWYAVPVILNAKYSIQLDTNLHLGVGALVGTGSWVFPDLGLALPFASLTVGDRKSNFTLSGGYGSIWYDGSQEGHILASVSGMTKVAKKISLVFDSFIFPATSSGGSTYALILPGVRFQTGQKGAFQFGFSGIYDGTEFLPVPIPFLQWYQKL